MGSDSVPVRGGHSVLNFNPRSPHGERQEYEAFDAMYAVFQSTLPAGGATEGELISYDRLTISIHAPRMGSDQWEDTKSALHFLISIHAPRMGSDLKTSALAKSWSYFNPRSPHGERPYAYVVDINAVEISIHAPRMGSDRSRQGHCCRDEYFNPRSPHGERPYYHP